MRSTKYPNCKSILSIIALLISAIAIPDCLGAPRSFEEIVVGFEVPRLIRKDIFAQYDGNNIYLPVVELFKMLELVIDDNLEEKQLSGYVINRDHRFNIDLNRFEVRSGGKKWPLVGSDSIWEKRPVFANRFIRPSLWAQDGFQFCGIAGFSTLKQRFPILPETVEKTGTRETAGQIGGLERCYDYS
jgi:hypothetical protein